MISGEAEAYENTALSPLEYGTCASVLQSLIIGAPNSNFQHVEQQQYLDVAVSILADSTSSGADPLEIQYLGWDYANGPGAGSEGDWDACQTLKNDQNNSTIGYALHQMQQDILISRDIQRNFETTRFCTVGSLAPWTVISYNPIQTWNAPFAGVCVPGVCTARSLYFLFIENSDFSENMLNAAIQQKDTSSSGISKFKYISSLKYSLETAKRFQMGVLCQGETGSAIIDKGYRDFGYYGTIILIMVLFIFVILGTVSSSLMKSKKRNQVNEENYFIAESSNDASPKQLPFSHVHKFDYGSTNGSGSIHCHNESPPVPNSSTKFHSLKFTNGSFSKATVPGIDHNDKDSIEKQKARASSGTIESLSSVFGTYFDASKNFYDITRLKPRHKDIEPQPQQRHQRLGGIDTHSSSTDFLMVYNYDTKRKGQKESSIETENTDQMGKFSNGSLPLKEQSTSSSKCINGLRSISLIWIILAHTLSTQANIGFTNPAQFFPPDGVTSTYFGVFILNASYAVDTFFFISGYLAMSGLIKRLDPEVERMNEPDEERQQSSSSIHWWSNFLTQIGIVNPYHVDVGDYGQKRLLQSDGISSNLRKKNWILPFLFHRMLRILPTYGFVLLLWWKVVITLGDGPFWPRWALYAQKCDQYAWTNLLFVNNLIPRSQPYGEMSECMFHTWYLGVDFQLFAVLNPIFVTLYLHFSRKITVVLEILLIFGIIAASVAGTFIFDWSAYPIDGTESAAYDRDFYINPFFRATPYIIGFITAQLWHEKSRLWPNFGLTSKAVFLLSLLSVSLMACLPFWGVNAYDKRPCLTYENPVMNSDCGTGQTQYERALHISSMRPLWSIGLALLSLLSFNGQLSCLGTHSFLTWSGWDPIGKLSFSMYLLHPLVGNFVLLGRTSKIRYSHIDLITTFAGILIITLLLSVVIGLLVEWPLSKMSRDFEKILKSKPSTSTSQNVETDTST